MFNVNINTDTKMMSSQNVTFKDQTPSYSYSVAANNDATFEVADRSDASLGEFFSRPVKIREFQWATTTTLFESFNPWTDYFTNPRVLNRITNFGLLRSKLCLKFVINGNGFHYGRIICSYIPLRDDDDFTVDRAFIPEDIVGASQRPHIYLDPTTSSGGTMCLPFFWYNNCLEVPNEEWSKMGTMIMHTMQSLQHANGANDSATISVFAWAEDVTLAVPTSSEPGGLSPQIGVESEFLPPYSKATSTTPIPRPWLSRKRNHDEIDIDTGIRIYSESTFLGPNKCFLWLANLSQDELETLLPKVRGLVLEMHNTPQMGMEDEYGKGPISRPASAVARVAGTLKNVPYIGAYARATEMAASATSAIATTFGYSRPNNLAAVSYMRPTVMGNLANANVEDSCIKLSVDAKQELTIDPATVGLASTDEMTINSIACRESWLTSFPWAVAATSEDMLWQTNVTPMTWAAVNIAAPTEIHMTACAFAALPFRHWYGSMKYRFQVVSSNYHKGRIKIVYDPHGFQSNEYNTNYTYIVDVAEDKDFTVQIGWGSDKPYCVVAAPGLDFGGTVLTADSVPYSSVATPVVPDSLANGVLRVYVVNELTIPNSTVPNDIEVNVFVSAGEDMQFRNPTDLLNEYQYFPQMGMEGDNDGTDEPNKPMAQEIDHQILNTVSTTDAYDHVFYGETLVSFRQLLKRYNFHTTRVPDFSGGVGSLLVTTTEGMYPYYKGLAPGAITEYGVTYNYAHTTLMNYLTPAYGAWRGGIKRKLHLHDVQNVRAGGFLSVSRTHEVLYSQDDLLYPGLDFTKAFYTKNKPPTNSGAITTALANCPTLEFEIPYQANIRFTPAKKANYTSDRQFSVGGFKSQYNLNTNGSTKALLDSYVAAGEDFSLFFYLGPPIMYHGVVAV
ncbi:polyprotein [Marine RNA virus PAL473]|uniref:Polyprotein n=1 Tax=Marine RNA virus PAL473 TaxID=1804156 RepID=A0A126SNS7_9VIRU|nr:polyprotein [Marine RNA virus PAL473]AMK49160.1 polyprotein [Marine RNA virus PAL473]